MDLPWVVTELGGAHRLFLATSPQNAKKLFSIMNQ